MGFNIIIQKIFWGETPPTPQKSLVPLALGPPFREILDPPLLLEHNQTWIRLHREHMMNLKILRLYQIF